MTWHIDNPEGAEAKKIAHFVVPYTRGRGLDIGCGPWKVWPHAIGLDNYDEWTGIDWRPDVFGNADDLNLFKDESLDFVFSSHLLEHLEDTEAVLSEWWRVIKSDGYLVLYLPHAELYPRMGEEGANPDHKHDFLPADIETAMRGIGSWDLEVNEVRSQGAEYSFLQVYKKAPMGDIATHRLGYLEHQGITQPRCLVIRYGGIGDCLIASSVLPGLKAEGYHIVFNTTERGKEVLQYDPNIDQFFLQDPKQVPEVQLGEYWESLGAEFDRCINLSESLEGTLLTMPGRRTHALADPARRLLCDVNYLEFAHAIARVSNEPKPTFYPTQQEKDWATGFRKPHRKSPIIVWALAGSSVHKAYPWLDFVTRWVIEHTKAKMVFVGGNVEQMLERGLCQQIAQHFLDMPFEESHEMPLGDLLLALKKHFGSNRLLCTAGKWSIREMLTFTVEQADIVVGPETGVMWAAAFQETPKIMFLSHSSENMISRDWVNTTVFESMGCPHSPCMRMHYSRDFCPQHEESGASLCAAAIKPERVMKSIEYWLKEQGL